MTALVNAGHWNAYAWELQLIVLWDKLITAFNLLRDDYNARVK